MMSSYSVFILQYSLACPPLIHRFAVPLPPQGECRQAYAPLSLRGSAATVAIRSPFHAPCHCEGAQRPWRSVLLFLGRGMRIATPVCALVRNDTLKFASDNLWFVSLHQFDDIASPRGSQGDAPQLSTFSGDGGCGLPHQCAHCFAMTH